MMNFNTDGWGGVLRKAVTASAILASIEPANAQFSYEGIMTPIQAVICGTYGIFIDIAATLAALVFIAAAVQWVISRDDPGKRKTAQDIMIHAIIGLILV